MMISSSCNRRIYINWRIENTKRYKFREKVILHRKSNFLPALIPLQLTILSPILQQERITVPSIHCNDNEWPQTHCYAMCHFVWATKKVRHSTRGGGCPGWGAPGSLPGWWNRSRSGRHLSFVKTHGPIHIRSVHFTVCKWYFDFSRERDWLARLLLPPKGGMCTPNRN